MKICNLRECDNKHDEGDWCKVHTRQLLQGRRLSPYLGQPVCSEDGCDYIEHTDGLCRKHLDFPDTKECAVDGCSKDILYHELCSRHFHLWFWNNRSLGRPASTRFVHTDCWLWEGNTEAGYGKFKLPLENGYTIRRTHRASYYLSRGYLPQKNGLVVRHLCSRPLCYRPEHLLLGTDIDNMADRDQSDRKMKATVSEALRQKVLKDFAGGLSLEYLVIKYDLTHYKVKGIVEDEFGPVNPPKAKIKTEAQKENVGTVSIRTADVNIFIRPKRQRRV